MDHFLKLNDTSSFTPFVHTTRSVGLVDRIPDCHAGGPGSNPWLGSTLFGGLIRQFVVSHRFRSKKLPNQKFTDFNIYAVV